MPAVATGSKALSRIDTTQCTQIVRGTIALSGVYGGSSTHGDTLNLGVAPTQSAKTPIAVFIYEQPAAGTAPTGYNFLYGAGSNATNGVLIVQQGAVNATVPGPSVEITAAAAYPAALVTAATAGYLKFEAVFPLGG
jgi:hypothetical protein